MLGRHRIAGHGGHEANSARFGTDLVGLGGSRLAREVFVLVKRRRPACGWCVVTNLGKESSCREELEGVRLREMVDFLLFAVRGVSPGCLFCRRGE